jgi:hypothetical protein
MRCGIRGDDGVAEEAGRPALRWFVDVPRLRNRRRRGGTISARVGGDCCGDFAVELVGVGVGLVQHRGAQRSVQRLVDAARGAAKCLHLILKPVDILSGARL